MRKKVYIGIDDHTTTCTYAVVDEGNDLLCRATVPTDLERLKWCLRGVEGEKHVAIENGTRAAWLYHGLREGCEEMMVANLSGLGRYRSAKSDPLDAAELARLLRAGVLKPVYHHTRESDQALMQATRCYEQINQDVVRTKNRVKSVFESLGMHCAGARVYSPSERERWLSKLGKRGHRGRAAVLLEELDGLVPLKKKAAERMIKLARKRNREYMILRSVPGMGLVSGARLMGHMGTPARFARKRGLWKASGLAVVTRSSGDFGVDWESGEIRDQRRIRTRGLNRDFNRAFKSIFKEAAHHAIRSGVFKEQYERRLERGMRPSLARLTIARKISAACLSCWQKGEKFDPEKMKSAGS